MIDPTDFEHGCTTKSLPPTEEYATEIGKDKAF